MGLPCEAEAALHGGRHSAETSSPTDETPVIEDLKGASAISFSNDVMPRKEEGMGPEATGMSGIATTSQDGRASAEPPTRTRLETWVVVGCILSSCFVYSLDVSIITTAIPTISAEFNSSEGYTWLGSAYLLANAATIPLWGKLSDIWGRKPIFLMSDVLFFVGSLVAALAGNMATLIAGRAIQGGAAGGLVAMVYTSVGDLFSVRERGLYYGYVSAVWAVSGALGPFLGGLFSEKATWRWCFWINLPITGIVFVGLSAFYKVHNPRTGVVEGLRAIDWVGTITLISGVLLFLLGLELGGVEYAWSSAMVLCLILFGLVLFVAFVIWQWRFARYPIMPMRMFNTRTLAATQAATGAHSCCYLVLSYYLPLYFQGVLGVSPLMAGIYLLPTTFGISVVATSTGYLIKKTGRWLIFVRGGFAFIVLGVGLLIDLGPKTNLAKIILYQLVASLGLGPNFDALTIALQSTTDAQDIAAASCSNNFIRMLLEAIAVVVGGVTFQNVIQSKQAYLSSVVNTTVAADLAGSSAAGNVLLVQGLPDGQRRIVRAVFNDATRTMWIVFTGVAAAGLFFSFLIRDCKLNEEHEVVETGLEAEERRFQHEKERRRSKASYNVAAAESSISAS